MQNPFNYNNQYDAKLKRLDIYQRYPELLPAIGKYFSKRKNKIIILGESHYSPDGIQRNSKEWYASDSSKLSDEEKKYINIRKIIESWADGSVKSKAFSIFNNLNKASKEIVGFMNSKDSIFDNVTFMNYFLRPAKTGKSIQRDEQDKQRAFDNLVKVCEILEVDHLIFVSRLAYNDFNWFYNNRNPLKLNVKYHHPIPHPSCSWWNRRSSKYINSQDEKVTGKNLFIDQLKTIESISS